MAVTYTVRTTGRRSATLHGVEEEQFNKYYLRLLEEDDGGGVIAIITTEPNQGLETLVPQIPDLQLMVDAYLGTGGRKGLPELISWQRIEALLAATEVAVNPCTVYRLSIRFQLDDYEDESTQKFIRRRVVVSLAATQHAVGGFEKTKGLYLGLMTWTLYGNYLDITPEINPERNQCKSLSHSL